MKLWREEKERRRERGGMKGKNKGGKGRRRGEEEGGEGE